MNRLAFLLTLLLMGLTTAAWAVGMSTSITTVNGQVVEVKKFPTPVPEVFNSFEETDSNGDGRVTKSEAHEAGILEFSVADTNNDGFLNNGEYYDAAHIPEMKRQ
jgi:hypothetical protein